MLAVEVQHLVNWFGLEKCGFFTLTVGDKTPPPISELQRRFHSLRTHVLAERYGPSIFVVERGERNNRLHFHGVVTLPVDIRTNRDGNGPVDFKAIARGDYRSANRNLRQEWAFWRKTAPSYGFGRTELLPVISTAEGVARYVGSYIKKQIMHRVPEDRGAKLVRLVNYKPGERKATSRFAWNTERAWLWRQKVATWAKYCGFESMEEVSELSPRWAYLFMEQILEMELPAGTVYPSRELAEEDGFRTCAGELRRMNVHLGHNRSGRATASYLLNKEREDYEKRPF